jgi:hypothetical protein
VGPPLAIAWILLNFAIAGVRRLHVSTAGSVIAVILTGVAAGAIAVGCYFALEFIWFQITTGAVLYIPPPEPRLR